MSLESLKTALPDYARDLKLNLGSLAAEPGLTEQQRAGTFVAAAYASRNADVIRALLAGVDFFEVETAREIRVFGNIAHVWSAYEARHVPGDAVPERRGINSIQLFKGEDGRWRILHMLWDNERDGVPLPAVG